MIDILVTSFQGELESLMRLAPRLVVAMAVLLLSVLVGWILARLLRPVLERAGLSLPLRSFIRRVTVWIFTILGTAMALNVVGLKTAASGVLAGGGITAVVLGFAFREIGENFLAGFLLAFSRPFRLGDVIQSGEFKGTVRGIEMRHTHVRTSDGRDIFLPNSDIINRPLINFTRDGLLRPAFTVGIDYAANAREACLVLRKAVGQVAGVAPEPPPSASIIGLESSWVLLEVAFWVDTFQDGISVSAVRTEVMEACRRGLREAEITVSSEVSTSLTLSTPEAVDVRLAGPAEPEV